MIQKTLNFDPPAKLSRKSDKLTSQASAAETEKKLGPLHQSFLCSLAVLHRSSTANEIAANCVAMDGGSCESYRKRALELVRSGHIEEAGERRCQQTGKLATVYKLKEHTNG